MASRLQGSFSCDPNFVVTCASNSMAFLHGFWGISTNGLILAYAVGLLPAEQISSPKRSLFLVCISLYIICVVAIVACGFFLFMCYFKYFYMYFILCVCLPACLCIACVPDTHKGLKYMWIPRNWSYRC